MPHPKGPWEARWGIVQKLDQGGQGYTFVVAPRAADGPQAVLKVLRNQNNPQRRARMFQEVGAMKVVRSAGGKVPAVIDGNLENFDKGNGPLYFVMERIEGRTLKSVVEERGGFSLDEAATVTLGLAETLERGHNIGVQHRDLKPDNMMLRGLSTGDVVLLDYGIAFNAERDEELTETGEPLRNDFFTPSERRVMGGPRQDPRSDIACLSAILYYCLTGCPPIEFRDGANRPPHRRQGFSVKERLRDDARLTQLESLFDRGFEQDADDRFQSIEEFRGRLLAVLKGADALSAEPLTDVALRLTNRIRRSHRQTQLREMGERGRELLETMGRLLGPECENLGHFMLQIAEQPQDSPGFPDGIDGCVGALELQMNFAHENTLRQVQYCIGAVGKQCGLFWRARDRRGGSGNENLRETHEIGREPILWFPGFDALRETDVEQAVQHAKKQIHRMMEDLANELSPQ